MRHIFTGRRMAIVVLACLLLAVAYFRFGMFAMRAFDNACRESFTVTTWVDSNRNGVRDTGELPLPHVALSFDGTPKNISARSTESGSDGIILVSLKGPWQGTFFNLNPGCDKDNQIVVIPIAPFGYHPVSAEPQPLTESLSFGFIDKESTDLPKPIPDLSCESFDLPLGDYRAFGLEGLITKPDESLFYGLDYFGHYTSDTNMQWFDADDVFGELQWIRTVEKGEDDVYWVLIFPRAQPNQRISKLHFANNKPVQIDIPSPFPEIIDIAVDPDGNVWAISLEEVARYEQENASWDYFELPEVNVSGHRSQKEPDSILFLHSGELVVSSHLQLAFGEYDASPAAITWSMLEFPDKVSNTLGSFYDGKRLWFRDMSVYFETEDQLWQEVNFQSESAPLEQYGLADEVVVIEDAIWFASGSKLFHVDHFNNSDWGSWPLYRGFDNIYHVSAESPTTLWVSDSDTLYRCEWQPIQ